MFNALYQDVRQWCRGKWAVARFPLWAGSFYILYHYLMDPDYGSVLSPLNLGIHELGHLLCMPFGQLIHIAGGTLIEVLAPFLAMLNFLRQRDYFAISLCFSWLSTILFEVARYVADARARALPLVSPFSFGEDIIHDWNYLLTHWGILEHDQLLAFLIRLAAGMSMIAGLFLGGWILWLMLTLEDGPASFKKT